MTDRAEGRPKVAGGVEITLRTVKELIAEE